jgi:hypothetical protein
MSEFELLQLVASWSELTHLSEAAYLTLLFAYLAAAQLVGAKLSRAQLIIVTIIYSVAVLRTIAAHFAQISHLVDFGDQLSELGSVHTVQVPRFSPYMIVSLWVIGFGASLIYMYSCRRSHRA